MRRFLALAVTLVACGSAGSAADVVVQYDFDDGLREGADGQLFVDDVSGNEHAGVLKSANGGDALVETVARGAGSALRFPGPCAEEDPALCPRAVVEVEGTRGQGPGGADFAVGVDFLLDGAGGVDQNIMQHGYWNDASEWKLGVGPDGLAYCVFRYTHGGETIGQKLDSAGAVDGGDWHTLRCERRGQELFMVVDGESAAVPVPPGHELDIASDRPIVLGGRNTAPASDQFHGAIDDAYFELL
jgi:opacity protein-like surface antigen